MTLLDKIMLKNGAADEPVLPHPTDGDYAGDLHVSWFRRMVEQAAIAGTQTEVHRLTPALANYLLADERNPMNRNISERTVCGYAQDIESGRWKFNGEPLIVSRDGFLNDGQHRCSAVVRTGISVEFLWVFGVTRDSRTTLDQGRARTAGDYLKMDGIPYGNTAARAASIVMQATKLGAAHDGPNRPTKSSVVEFIHKHPALLESCAAIPSNVRAIGGHTTLAAAHYLISQVAEAATVADFFEKLVNGNDLTSRHPILTCRTRLTNMVLTREKVNTRLECVIKGWNNYRSSRRVRSITITGGRLPQIAV